MPQFRCTTCGDGFSQLSQFNRHVQTSHPERAVSAADIAAALRGLNFPQHRDQLVQWASDTAPAVAQVLQELPERAYRDSAEVTRGLGEIRSRTAASDHQPSRRGGQHAVHSSSATRVAHLLRGARFPMTATQLRDQVRGEASDEDMGILGCFRERSFSDMADVERELGHVLNNNGRA